MASVEETIEVKASVKDCLAVITDYEAYPDFLKETKEVIVGKKSGKTCEVTFHIEVIKKISYTLKMTEGAKGITWTFVKGDMMKDNKGSWKLEDLGDGLTSATYSIDVNLGLLVPGSVAKMLIGSNLPAMLKAFKQRIESKSKKKK